MAVLLDHRGNPIVHRRTADGHRPIRARYDAAQTTDNNRRWWANADSLSSVAANSPEVRAILRDRSRYEVANNSYAEGIVSTRANDIVGTGPRLVLRGVDETVAKAVKDGWNDWCEQVSLPQKLWTLVRAWDTDGEGILHIVDNSAIVGNVPMDIAEIECDRLTSQFVPGFGLKPLDGIDLDDEGRPDTYWILPQHPGGFHGTPMQAPRPVMAEFVIHLFSHQRPEQYRGIPKLTPALPLFAMMRDYTLASLDAAKAAAYFAGVLESQYPGETEEIQAVLDTIELERNLLTTLPYGTKLNQVDAKQPTDRYVEFKHEILNEIARCLDMPFNIAACNSSGYNYASGRLDHQTYYRSIDVARSLVQRVALDRLYRRWMVEASQMRMFDGIDSAMGVRPKWMWDKHPHVDPVKEAVAAQIRLENRMETLADFYAEEGEDYVEQLAQLATESRQVAESGVFIPWMQAAPAPAPAQRGATTNAALASALAVEVPS